MLTLPGIFITLGILFLTSLFFFIKPQHLENLLLKLRLCKPLPNQKDHAKRLKRIKYLSLLLVVLALFGAALMVLFAALIIYILLLAFGYR